MNKSLPISRMRLAKPITPFTVGDVETRCTAVAPGKDSVACILAVLEAGKKESILASETKTLSLTHLAGSKVTGRRSLSSDLVRVGCEKKQRNQLNSISEAVLLSLASRHGMLANGFGSGPTATSGARKSLDAPCSCHGGLSQETAPHGMCLPQLLSCIHIYAPHSA